MIPSVGSTTGRRVPGPARLSSACSLFGLLTIPSLIKEGADFVVKLQSDSVWVVILDKMRHGLGDGIMDKVEQLVLMVSSEDLQRAAAAATESAAKRTQVVGSALHAMLSEYTESAVRMTTTLVTATTKAALNVAISLILSFMFTWDLPTIAQGVRSLASSRIAPVYNEVAPAVLVFATLFGKALEAQARISLTNTVLTGGGRPAHADVSMTVAAQPSAGQPVSSTKTCAPPTRPQAWACGLSTSPASASCPSSSSSVASCPSPACSSAPCPWASSRLPK